RQDDAARQKDKETGAVRADSHRLEKAAVFTGSSSESRPILKREAASRRSVARFFRSWSSVSSLGVSRNFGIAARRASVMRFRNPARAPRRPLPPPRRARRGGERGRGCPGGGNAGSRRRALPRTGGAAPGKAKRG